MSANKAMNPDFLALCDGEIIAQSRFQQDVRNSARDHVKAVPGARVRMYRGEETIFSFVQVDDDLPKEMAAKESP